MMDTTKRSHTPMRARTMAELLPGIKSLLTKDTVQRINAMKQPCTNVPPTRTNMKPLTMAELSALIGPTPLKSLPPTSSRSTTRAKPWNSSIKVDRSKALTKDGQMKYSTVRKELNFQSKPKPVTTANSRVTMAAGVARKSVHLQIKSNIADVTRMSGVCRIPDTPDIAPKQRAVQPPTQKTNIVMKLDDSFIQREKEINDCLEQSNALNEPNLENIAQVSPPVSTPFKDYRNVEDYFNLSENSVLCNDNITKCAIDKTDKVLEDKNSKNDDSLIVSLCEILSQTTVTNSNNSYQEVSDLREVERQIESQVIIADNVIKMLETMKKEKIKSLEHIRNCIQKKKKEKIVSSENNSTNATKENIDTNIAKHINANLPKEKVVTFTVNKEEISPKSSPITSRPTVIKSKCPTYKTSRKSICLRKRVLCKSVSNVSDNIQTPMKKNDKAINMYMQMKENMTFLSTPLAKPHTEIPDTPAITSRNLQRQLDKLFN